MCVCRCVCVINYKKMIHKKKKTSVQKGLKVEFFLTFLLREQFEAIFATSTDHSDLTFIHIFEGSRAERGEAGAWHCSLKEETQHISLFRGNLHQRHWVTCCWHAFLLHPHGVFTLSCVTCTFFGRCCSCFTAQWLTCSPSITPCSSPLSLLSLSMLSAM